MSYRSGINGLSALTHRQTDGRTVPFLNTTLCPRKK